MKIITLLRHRLSYALKSPIDPELIKTQQGRQQIERRLAMRYKSPLLLQNTIEQYQHFRKDLHQFEAVSRECNSIKSNIKEQVKKDRNSNVDELKATLSKGKQRLTEQESQLKRSKIEYESFLNQIGNTVSSQTPISSDEGNNKTIKYYHPHKNISKLEETTNHETLIKENFRSEEKARSYQQLTEKFKIADLSRGQKVSGHRGYFLTGNGVKMALALAQYGLDFLQQRGYAIYQTPTLILESVLKQSCQLQTIQSDMYRFPLDDLCLIATSQQSLAGYYKNETFEPKQLSKKMAGYSSCFRRQAGAHGKDIHGLFRVHQFQKVEQFAICTPQESQKMQLQMVQNAQLFYQSLQIPYRLVDIVSGQLNNASIRKIDLEAWYPSQQKFRQLVSISNCTDYQARLLDIKYRSGQHTKYPHMLNGTLIAIQRAITCLLEHLYSKDDNTIKIPKALQPYIRCDVLRYG